MPCGSGREILLQGFNWEVHSRINPSWYQTLASKAGALAVAGITAIWLPPPSVSVSKEGYLPREYEVLSSAYGTEVELRACVQALHAVNIKALADVVINHRCASAQDETGKWNVFGGQYAWNADHICANSGEEYAGRGARKDTETFAAAPNIDHTHEGVKKDIIAWLRSLQRDIGFDGWRFDFVKGYQGCHVREYITATSPALAVGEYWDACNYDESGKLEFDQDSHRQRIVDWCDATGGLAAAFDFTTKGVLQEAVGNKEYWRLRDKDGKPPGVIGWWPSRAVTFVDSHDTGSTQQHWPFPEHGLPQAYALILTHPGTPCIFLDHLTTSGISRPSLWRRLKRLVSLRSSNRRSRFSLLRPLASTIVDLIRARQRNGITSVSEVTILEASDTTYAACIGKRLVLKLGPGGWSPVAAGLDVGQKAWLPVVKGRDFAVWEAKYEGDPVDRLSWVGSTELRQLSHQLSGKYSLGTVSE